MSYRRRRRRGVCCWIGPSIGSSTWPSYSYFNRAVNTSSTAYPSGSARNPTRIIVSSPTISQINPSDKSRTVPDSHKKLPDLPSRKPIYVASFVIISCIWATFIYFSTNAEKANSSVVKAILFELRNNPRIQTALGDSIKPLRDDFFGQLWVGGQISLMQGSVDVAFRVIGSENSGKIYFTSVRRDRDSEFEIIRWKLIRDDGLVIDLVNQNMGSVLLTTNRDDQDHSAITKNSSLYDRSNPNPYTNESINRSEDREPARLV